MKIRIEFTRPGQGHSNLTWRWLIRTCKQLPTFKEHAEDGIEFYTLEFTERTMAPFLAIYERIQFWKNVNTYVNDELVSRAECWKRIGELTRERRAGMRKVREMLSDLLPERKDLGF